MDKNAMYYHLLAEVTIDGKECYRLVKTYRRWCSNPMMNFLLEQTGRVWVVACRHDFFMTFASIGLPSTYVWTQTSWREERMPVKPLARK